MTKVYLIGSLLCFVFAFGMYFSTEKVYNECKDKMDGRKCQWIKR